MVTETSALDPFEGIRFRGFTFPDLQEKLPKAEAWRNTVMDLWERGGTLGDYHSWAAFSLCGDWR